MNEADTCRTYLLPKLKDAHWEEDAILEQYVLTPGRIVPLGGQHTWMACRRRSPSCGCSRQRRRRNWMR